MIQSSPRLPHSLVYEKLSLTWQLLWFEVTRVVSGSTCTSCKDQLSFPLEWLIISSRHGNVVSYQILRGEMSRFRSQQVQGSKEGSLVGRSLLVYFEMRSRASDRYWITIMISVINKKKILITLSAIVASKREAREETEGPRLKWRRSVSQGSR